MHLLVQDREVLADRSTSKRARGGRSDASAALGRHRCSLHRSRSARGSRPAAGARARALGSGSTAIGRATSLAKRDVSRRARRRLVDARGLQVEERVLVELADRRAVLHFTSSAKISSCGLRVDLDVVRQQQVLVRLLRVGLLRVRAHDDLAVEHAARACRRGRPCRARGSCSAARVVDDGVVVDVLLAADQVEAVERALARPRRRAHASTSLRDERAAERDARDEAKRLSALLAACDVGRRGTASAPSSLQRGRWSTSGAGAERRSRSRRW